MLIALPGGRFPLDRTYARPPQPGGNVARFHVERGTIMIRKLTTGCRTVRSNDSQPS